MVYTGIKNESSKQCDLAPYYTLKSTLQKLHCNILAKSPKHSRYENIVKHFCQGDFHYKHNIDEIKLYTSVLNTNFAVFFIVYV